MFVFQNSSKNLAKLQCNLWAENQLMKQRGAGKNKRALAKTKGRSTLLFWAGENTAAVEELLKVHVPILDHLGITKF